VRLGTFNLLWEDRSNEEDGFYIERKMEADGTYVRIAEVAANTTTYVDDVVISGIFYCYRVSAFNSETDSDYSNEVCSIAP
jgi:titin